MGLWSKVSRSDEGADTAWPFELQWWADRDGLGLEVVTEAPLPEAATVFLTLADADGDWVEAAEGYADDDGYLEVCLEFEGDRATTYLPFGAVFHEGAGDFSVGLTVVCPVEDGFEPMGRAWRILPLPEPRRRGWRAELLRPFVGLCMVVARADGGLTAAGVSAVKGCLEACFSVGADDGLRQVMKAEPSSSVPELVEALALRMPHADLGLLFDELVVVAEADGAGVEAGTALDEIAETFGTPRAPTPEVLAAYVVLGVAWGCGRAALKAAYRKRLAAYHPDRVASLPEEFQAVAHEKSVEIRAAYDLALGD